MKQALYLSYPITPEIRHGPGFFRSSRFIMELPIDCFEEIVVEDV